MTLPTGDNSQRFSILLEFATNEQLYNEVFEKTKDIADETKRAEETSRLYGEAIKKVYPELYKQIQAEKELAEKTQQATEATKKQNAELQVQIRNLRSQSREIIAQTRIIRDNADDWDRLFNPLAAGGALVTGGIFAFVKNYVSDAEQATAATEGWKAAQDDLERSGDRIGEVLARETLPLLQDVSNVTRQIAGVLEAHPEVARAVLVGGIVALAAGTLGKLYTQGLRLYADIKLDKAMALQLTAAELQLQASNNQLRAAGLQAGASPASPPKGVGGVGLSGLALLAGVGGIGAVGTLKLFQEGIAFGVKSGERFEQALVNIGIISEDTAENLDQTRESMYQWARQLPVIGGLFSEVVDDMESKVAGVQASAPSTAQSFLGGSKEIQDQIVDTFYQWQQDDAEIVSNAMEARKQIVAEGEKAIADITASFINQRASIAARFDAEAASITSRYTEETKQAEIDYQNERASILSEGNERIQEIEADHQEELRKMEQDSFERQAELISDRDALGLVKEQRRLQDARAEAENSANEAIAREKQETAQRLNELQVRYAQERQQRQAQYEQDLKENALRRAQALKEAQDQYNAEIKQQREANAAKLKEADAAAQAERLRRRQQLITQLQDLDSSLSAERNLRNSNYNLILMEAAQFMDGLRAAYSPGGAYTTSVTSLGTNASGGSTTTLNGNPNFDNSGQYGTLHDFTGYANPGLYQFNQREYVLDQPATRAAERAIGGQITPDIMARMFAMMGAARKSVQLVDNSRYEAGMNARIRRDIRDDTRRELDALLRG